MAAFDPFEPIMESFDARTGGGAGGRRQPPRVQTQPTPAPAPVSGGGGSQPVTTGGQSAYWAPESVQQRTHNVQAETLGSPDLFGLGNFLNNRSFQRLWERDDVGPDRAPETDRFYDIGKDRQYTSSGKGGAIWSAEGKLDEPLFPGWAPGREWDTFQNVLVNKFHPGTPGTVDNRNNQQRGVESQGGDAAYFAGPMGPQQNPDNTGRAGLIPGGGRPLVGAPAGPGQPIRHDLIPEPRYGGWAG